MGAKRRSCSLTQKEKQSHESTKNTKADTKEPFFPFRVLFRAFRVFVALLVLDTPAGRSRHVDTVFLVALRARDKMSALSMV
jgi:hypothetical protein